MRSRQAFQLSRAADRRVHQLVADDQRGRNWKTREDITQPS